MKMSDGSEVDFKSFCIHVITCVCKFQPESVNVSNMQTEHTYMTDLLVAGGRDAGLSFICALQSLRPRSALLLLLPLALVLLVQRAAILHLCFPAAALPQEALVHLQLLARLLPAAAALHLQLLDAHLDVLDVVRGDPGSAVEEVNRGEG